MLRSLAICMFFSAASAAQCLGGEIGGRDENGVFLPVSGVSAGTAYAALVRVVRDHEGERVWFAGREGAKYDEIVDAELSADGKGLAYVARKGGKLVVVDDGREGAAYEEIGELRFSPDGTRLAYRAKKGPGGRGGGWVMVVDGREGQDHMMIAEESPTFSPDGRSIAYVVRHHAHRALGWRLFQGLWPTERVPSVVVVDEQEGPRLDDVVAESLTFSPDGRRVAYVGTLHNKANVFVDGLPCKGCESVSEASRWLVFRPDSRRIAYWAGDRWRAIVNGEQCEVQPEEKLEPPWDLSDPLRNLSAEIHLYMGMHGERESKQEQLLRKARARMPISGILFAVMLGGQKPILLPVLPAETPKASKALREGTLNLNQLADILPQTYVEPETGEFFGTNPAVSRKRLSDLKDPARTIIVYQVKPGREGLRRVLFADGRVGRLSETRWTVLKMRSGILQQ